MSPEQLTLTRPAADLRALFVKLNISLLISMHVYYAHTQVVWTGGARSILLWCALTGAYLGALISKEVDAAEPGEAAVSVQGMGPEGQERRPAIDPSKVRAAPQRVASELMQRNLLCVERVLFCGVRRHRGTASTFSGKNGLFRSSSNASAAAWLPGGQQLLRYYVSPAEAPLNQKLLRCIFWISGGCPCGQPRQMAPSIAGLPYISCP